MSSLLFGLGGFYDEGRAGTIVTMDDAECCALLHVVVVASEAEGRRKRMKCAEHVGKRCKQDQTRNEVRLDYVF